MSKSNKSNRAPRILETVESANPSNPSNVQTVETATETVASTTETAEPAVIQQVQSEQSSSSTLDDKGRIRVVPFTAEEWWNLKKANGLGSTSAQMRYLVGRNYSPSATATFLGKRYQHVRNVMNQILKRPS